MARIPEAEIERIKREVDLADLVRSKGIELKKHGSKDLAGTCPFHPDDTASFIVSPRKNLFHCMGCGKAGSNIDFVMSYEGVSFRHAFEILAKVDVSLLQSSGPVKKSSVPKLPPPVAFDADDRTILTQAVDFYHERLKQTPVALDYLHGRGITDEAINYFKIGFADRTLGLRLPYTQTKTGAAIRERLKRIGILREETGHEHFNGCVVFPIVKEGEITEIYGRKIRDDLRKGTVYHLYLPGPHVGIFNAEALESRKVILCESVIDALTFWSAGIRNVTCIYGIEGFTEELFQTLIEQKIESVYLAYDRDQAGDRATERDVKKLAGVGIECFRILFPSGMDANEYALKVTPAAKSLELLVNSADWLGGKPKIADPSFSLVATKLAANVESSEEADKCLVAAPTEAAVPEETAKEKAGLPDQPKLRQSGEDLLFEIGDRVYRIRGFDKKGIDCAMKINLRLSRGDLYFVNVLDLYQSKLRAQFIDEASRETLIDRELIKRDLGKLMLKLEEFRSEPESTKLEAVPVLKPEDYASAMELLLDPNLLERIVTDLDLCGIVGERVNKLTGYIAAVSRKLDRPLAIIIQSTSAAGKTAMMDAILAMMPMEERIKYSAMTGQSLYYLGEKNLKHKILAIVEEEGAEKASYALKLLQSEGELTIASTSKDELGRMKTEEYRVEGPVMIILTTTAVDIDEELLNRCIILTVDESREQTEAIHERQREAETLEGLLQKVKKEEILAIHQNAQRLLRALPVINPYARKLKFLSDRTRTRRDHTKYLILIRTIALLHQFQREVKLINGIEYIEVLPSDIVAANALAHEVLGRSLDELPPQTRKLLGLIDTLVRKICREESIERSRCRITRRQIREFTGWSNAALKVHLDRLMDLEYLTKHSGKNGQTYVYELVFDGDAESMKPQLSGLATIEDLMHDDLFAQYDRNLSGLNGHLLGSNGHLLGSNGHLLGSNGHLSPEKSNLTPTFRAPFTHLSGGFREEKTPGNPHESKGSELFASENGSESQEPPKK